MTKDEALKLALEALETKGEHHPRVYQAITAIKEALAQPKHIGFMDSKLNPIQRTWVGLTDEDQFEFAKAQPSWEDLLIAAEAKLKEKNT
jgi:hypothetical protein